MAIVDKTANVKALRLNPDAFGVQQPEQVRSAFAVDGLSDSASFGSLRSHNWQSLFDELPLLLVLSLEGDNLRPGRGSNSAKFRRRRGFIGCGRPYRSLIADS